MAFGQHSVSPSVPSQLEGWLKDEASGPCVSTMVASGENVPPFAPLPDSVTPEAAAFASTATTDESAMTPKQD